jgi:hypothetical protein
MLNNTNYTYVSELITKDLNQNDIIVKEINGDIYSLDKNIPYNLHIYSPLPSNLTNIVKQRDGEKGSEYNICIMFSLIIDESNILSHEYIVDIIKTILTKKSNLITNSIELKYKNNINYLNIIAGFNFHINYIDIYNFYHILLDKDKFNEYFDNLNIYLNYDYNILLIRKNIDFNISNIKIEYIKDDNIIKINIDSVGLFNKCVCNINGIINVLNDTNTTVKLNDEKLPDNYVFHIKFFNTIQDTVMEKILFLNSITNLEIITHTMDIYNGISASNISVSDNKYYVNGVKQDSIVIKKGVQHILDQSHSSNLLYPINIYLDNSSSPQILEEGVNYYIDEYLTTKELYIKKIHTSITRRIELIIPSHLNINILYYGCHHYSNDINIMGGIITVEDT